MASYEGDNPFSLNIKGVENLVESGINKVAGSGGEQVEGATGTKIDVLDLPMSDDELLDLRDSWEKAYAPYESKVAKPIAKRNLRSYLGRNKNNTIDEEAITAANLQFEAEETFLPAALAQNPSPFVYSDNTPEGNKISDDVETMLQFHADQLLLRHKLALMTRQWSINQLGVLKPGWNTVINDIALENRKIQDFIFDPNGFVDAYGDFSSWLGERITVTAEKLVELFPKHKVYIVLEVGGKMGTDVTYTEWWNDDYCFTTFKEKVLDKHKNEYFNYEDKRAEADPMTGMMPTVKRNHFAVPKKPYVFMSVFSLQERPHDITGLIEQNIANQNKITKRSEQIDSNLSQSNNGIAFSENNFNQETAKQAANALTNGVGKVLVPAGGPIGEAIVRIPAPNLPNGFFDDLENSKNDLRSQWGTQGISSQQQKPEETARGMILEQGRDTSRIGGGIGDVIEQSVARNVFNWFVQLYMVFYDEPHFGAIMGSGKATEYVTLSAQNIDRQLIVGVTANSMKPKDSVAKANEATVAFTNGSIGPKTYLEAIDFSNADEAAGDGALYKMSMETDGGRLYIQANFPELWQSIQGILQQQVQEQAQSQQAQAQQEAQGVAQKQEQGAQAVQQQMSQKEATHQQELRHGEESHKAKIQQSTEQASAKLSQMKLPK